MKRFLFAVLCTIPGMLLGQNTISGTLLDKKTQEPLPYATVYIDGTTKGTATDNLGRFTLKNVPVPSTVVFSFVGYETEAIVLENNLGELLIELNPYKELPQVDIDGEERKIHLDYFRNKFLGEDLWGTHATIKNDEVLFFDSKSQGRIEFRSNNLNGLLENYDPNASNSAMTLNLKNVTFLSVKKRTFTSFKAWANGPLIIDLPLLGYELYVDLVSFTVQEDQWGWETLCEMLGYFYFKPYDTEKASQIKKFEKNRKLAYYGSSQHFLRSWYQGRLKENGYALVVPSGEKPSDISGPESIDLIQLVPMDIGRYSQYTESGDIQVIGLKGKMLDLLYFHKRNGSPVQLKDGDYPDVDYSASEITFKQDTCVFMKDGTVIDNNIVFKGEISEKRVASLLPSDYIPSED